HSLVRRYSGLFWQNRTVLADCATNCRERDNYYPVISRNIRSLRGSDLSAALFTLAHLAEVVPGIDSCGVAVIPGNAHGVAAYGLHFFRTGRVLIHRQQSVRGLGRLSGLAMIVVSFFVAGGARTG